MRNHLFVRPSLGSFFALVMIFLLFIGLFAGSVTVAQAQDIPTPTPPPGGDEPTIVGGGPASLGEWPWQVALVGGTSTDLYNSQFCGGSLVAAQWVVTAAHCVYGSAPSSLDVVAGIYNLATPASGFQRRDVVQIIVHPNYNDATSDFDIALLKLASPVTLGGSGETKTAAVPLVSSSVGNLVGVSAWVTGWGNTESVPQWPTQLQEVQVPIMSTSICNDLNHYGGSITNNMMCAGLDAGGKDSCQGDSGGPLVVQINGQWQLAGVVSWGDGCADPYRPGVYTRVSNFVSWVNSYVPTSTTTTKTYRSIALHDGWVLESGETSNVGGSINSTVNLYVGDDANNRQYRSILSFDTSGLPDNAQIKSVVLKLRKSGAVGLDPFTILGKIAVDVRKGPFGGTGNAALQLGDFSAAASQNGALLISNAPVNGWYSASMGAASFVHVNLLGVTQFRLRFQTDDNNNFSADQIRFYSGDATDAILRPQLIIQYTLP